jgi:hypothetical protein
MMQLCEPSMNSSSKILCSSAQPQHEDPLQWCSAVRDASIKPEEYNVSAMAGPAAHLLQATSFRVFVVVITTFMRASLARLARPSKPCYDCVIAVTQC